MISDRFRLLSQKDPPILLSAVALIIGAVVGAIACGLILRATLTGYLNMAIFLIGSVCFIVWAASRIISDLHGDRSAPANLIGLLGFLVGSVLPLIGSKDLTESGSLSWPMICWLVVVALFLVEMERHRRTRTPQQP